MSEREHTIVKVRKSTKPRFEQAKESVAQEIGGQPTNADVVEELVRAYLGNKPLGEWQEE